MGVLGRLRLWAGEEGELLRLGTLPTLLTLPESALFGLLFPFRTGITTPGAARPRREKRGVVSYGVDVSQFSPDSRCDKREPGRVGAEGNDIGIPSGPRSSFSGSETLRVGTGCDTLRRLSGRLGMTSVPKGVESCRLGDRAG